MGQQETFNVGYIMAKSIIIQPIDSNPINAQNAKIECLESEFGVSEEPQYPKDFSMSFTCNLNNAAIDYLFGNKRERYETSSIYRYAHIKKSRKKKQMLRYCKKYNFKIVGYTRK